MQSLAGASLLEVINTLGLACLGFLVWTIKTHVTKRIEKQAEVYGELDGKLANLPRLLQLEDTLAKAKTEIETAARRMLDNESLSRAHRLEHLERQLGEFYWPLYIRLEKDNALWQRMKKSNLFDHPDKATSAELGRVLEKSFILPNHEEMVKILESKLHLMLQDAALLVVAKQYIGHVAVFVALRACGIDNVDPSDLHEPWPAEFFPLIAEHTRALQQQLNEALAIGAT